MPAHAPPAPATSALTIRAEPFDGPDGAAMRAELEAELRRRYGEDSEPGTPPTAADTPVFLIVRDRSGRALGCGALRTLGPQTVEIKRMYVRLADRRRGVARALLEALEERAGRLGARWIVLETGPRQPEAIRLYARQGYRPIPCAGVLAGSRRSMCFARAVPSPALP
ncbi:MAG TPA: GNAT family N-acetyltransferase [Solirubrobacteraceae bacterium]|jgi:GNAT superfamily N-acetyltransferase|nr:GNAT family N-acetyltransferase [Solirubrobacteraceae bacterium]